MIDYRPIIVTYIKSKAVLTKVLNGILTFEQPTGDYASYYILNESPASFMTNGTAVVNDTDPTLLDETYSPLTIVTIQLDIRGPNSFTKARDLHKSFGTINNKKTLADQGVSFMNVTGVTPLPQLKNTKQEEGYIFSLTISYDNSFIEQSVIGDVVTVTKT